MSVVAKRGLAVVLVIAALGGGLAWWSRATKGPRVDAYQAVQRPIRQTLLVSGRVAPPARVALGAQVQSTVVEVLVAEGDVVEAGTLLARLADDEAGAKLREAEAQVDEAAARLQRVRGVGRQVASEQLKQARLNLDAAELELSRAELLYRARSTTESAYDSARKARDSARSQWVAAQLEVSASDANGADTVTAAATLARVQASLELAQAGVERTRLRAPGPGQVLQRHIEVGQVVRPGDVLLEFATRGPLQVHVTPDEFHLGALRQGQAAKVVVEAFPDRPFQAQVSWIAPQIDPTRGTVEVHLALVDEVDATQLLPDMSATVEVLLGEREDALVLPTWLVRDLGAGRPWVLVADQGIATRRWVSLGLLGDEAVEITSGLGEGEAVIGIDAGVEVDEPVRTRAARPALLGG